MSGHTPGPWMARPNEPDNGEWEVVKPDPNKPYAEDPWFVCVCFDDADGFSGEANAHLIAAAPDFAEAAPDAADVLEHYVAYIRELPSAELERHPYLPMVEQAAADLRVAIAKSKGEA